MAPSESGQPPSSKWGNSKILIRRFRSHLYARHVLARMAGCLTDEGTPWPGRLWEIGSVLALEDPWEAGHWQAHNVLSSTASGRQRAELRTVIGPDRGSGHGRNRQCDGRRTARRWSGVGIAPLASKAARRHPGQSGASTPGG